MTRFSVGIVGAGRIVEDAHLPVLKNLPVDVRWVTDRSDQRAELVGRMYDVRPLHIEAVNDAIGDVDVCLIAVPLDARRPYIETCARAQVAVYVEKPFAASRAEHDDYCSRFSSYRIATGFQRRYYASTHMVEEMVVSGVLGALRKIEFAYGQFSLQSRGAERYITRGALSGGGMIIDSAIHVLDQILCSTRATAVHVNSANAVVLNGTDYEAVVNSTLQLNGDCVPVTCEITRLRNIRQRTRYVFENAVLQVGMMPDGPLTIVPVSGDGRPVFNVQPTVSRTCASTVAQAFFLVWSDFLRGLQEQRETPAAAVRSALTTAWVEDIYGLVLGD